MKKNDSNKEYIEPSVTILNLAEDVVRTSGKETGGGWVNIDLDDTFNNGNND